MKKALVILLALTMVMSMMAIAPIGVSAEEELAVGSVAADYKPEGTAIKTAEEFAAMDPAGTYYLANDITISETYAVDFTGTFDGNGKSITTSVPVFAEFDGVLKNLITKGAVVIEGEKEGTYETFRGVVANIVGHYADTEITNVCNMAPITSATLAVGGVVGMVSNDRDFKVTFTKVVNYGNITASNSSTSYDCGGIAGQFDGNNTNENHGEDHRYVKFIDCANYGTINACGRPGGIIGYANASTEFKNCYNAGEIQSTANYCGGIAGRLDGDTGYNYYLIENCVNDGKIIVFKSQGAGFVGYCGGFSELIYRNCTNNGDVVGHNDNVVDLTLGGFHGNNRVEAKKLVFENCVNNGNIGTNQWAKKINAGGIAGTTNGTSVLFTDCVNNGTIKGTGTGNCGGIVAGSNGSAAKVLPMFVTITKCINYGDVSGIGGYTSGILGYSYASYEYGPTITYCVNTGDISCQTGTCAGLIGYMNCGYVGATLEYNIIGGSLNGQTATPVADGATVSVRTMYSYTNAAGDTQYFYAPEAGTLKIENDVVTYIPNADKAFTVKTPANGATVAKNDVIKFVANDGKTYIAPAYAAGTIAIDYDKVTLTIGSVTVIGVEVPADFDGSSLVLNTFDHPIATAAIMWNNNSSIAVDASKNVILDGVGDVDYVQGTSNKWGYIGNTCDAVAPRTSLADIASGKVAYELNQAIGEEVFYQNLLPTIFVVDEYPTPDATHAKVIVSAGQYTNQLFEMNPDVTPPTGDATVYVVIALAVATVSLAALAVVKKNKEN